MERMTAVQDVTKGASHNWFRVILDNVSVHECVVQMLCAASCPRD